MPSPFLPPSSLLPSSLRRRAAFALAGLVAATSALAQSVQPPPRTLVPLHDSAASKPAPLSLLAATAPSASASSPESSLPPIPGAPSASARVPLGFGLGDTVELRIDADQSLGGPARPALQAREDVLKLPGGPRLVVSPAVGLARAPDGHFFASGLFAVTMDQPLSRDARAFVQVRGDRFSLVHEETPEMTLAAGVGWTPRRALSVDLSMAQGITPGTAPWQGRGAVHLKF